jgi:hypothetical protein
MFTNYDSTFFRHDTQMIVKTYKIYTPWIYYFHVQICNITNFFSFIFDTNETNLYLC